MPAHQSSDIVGGFMLLAGNPRIFCVPWAINVRAKTMRIRLSASGAKRSRVLFTEQSLLSVRCVRQVLLPAAPQHGIAGRQTTVCFDARSQCRERPTAMRTQGRAANSLPGNSGSDK